MSLKPIALDGAVLAPLVDAALGDEAPREALYRALLEEPLCVAEVGAGAPPGPTVKLGSAPTTPAAALLKAVRPESAQIHARLTEAPRLGAPVVPLFVSGTAAVEWAEERGIWPDGVERGVVYEKGAAFPLLKGHPGAVVVAGPGRALQLDAGEIVALAERQTPTEYIEALRKLLASGRPREAVRRLAARPLYTLGHPHGGMLMFGRDLPVFLHLSNAERFAARLAQQSGTKAHHGLVAAAELFKNALRGKLFVLIDPGPHVLRLRPEDMR